MKKKSGVSVAETPDFTLELQASGLRFLGDRIVGTGHGFGLELGLGGCCGLVLGLIERDDLRCA